MLDGSTKVRQSTRQVSCKLDEEVAILNLERSVYFGLQGVGAHIWRTLENPVSVDDVCASVSEAFDVSAARCRGDVEKFLGELQEVGLVEAVK